MFEQLIEDIKGAVPQAVVHIRTPRGDTRHLEGLIISPAFEGKSELEKHRMVMKAVDFDTTVHAFSLKTFTPEEWEDIKGEYEDVEEVELQDPLADVKEQIDKDIKSHDIVLYMKGKKERPMCGFSMQVVKALNMLGVEDFYDVNILEDDHVRAAIKEYSDWPTLPQLYIKGEFIGGCDIVLSMYESGELEEKIKNIGN